MKTIFAGVLGIGLLIAAPGLAITFNFNGGSGTQANAFDFTSNGLNLHVSTALFDANYIIYETTPLLDRGSAGLGMKNPYNDKGIGIDGWGKFELAVFSFNQAVVFNSITLSLIPNKFNLSGTNVKFRIWDESGGGFADRTITYLIASSGAFGLPAGMQGDLFGFGANKRQAEFRISSINVSLVPSTLRIAQTSPVPLPATLPLFAVALGFLGWQWRAKRG